MKKLSEFKILETKQEGEEFFYYIYIVNYKFNGKIGEENWFKINQRRYNQLEKYSEFIDFLKDDFRHRDNAPAIIYYYSNSSIAEETYYVNNKKHNLKGPAQIFYDSRNNNIVSKYYYIDNNKLDIISDEEFKKHIKLLNLL